jgi:hypothetical protein
MLAQHPEAVPPVELPVRLGLFVALFASLLVVLAISVPVRVTPPALPGGPEPVTGAQPRCVHLRYEPATPDSRWLPRLARLNASPRFRDGWYRADLDPALSGFWRPAGRDSVDIVQYHGLRLIRVSLRGGPAAGRLTPAGTTPLASLLGQRDYVVGASIESCAPGALAAI